MKKNWAFVLLIVVLFTSCNQSSQNKTVLLAILARNKEHTLPKFLECIEKLEYDKKAIVVYINTNNNSDNTEEILKLWADKWKNSYREIVFESHNLEILNDDESLPHQWDSKRLSTLAHIRKTSLDKTLEHGCDFYFVADCDNFLTPPTLKTLVEKDKQIVAPMLDSLPGSQFYSNFFCEVDINGYYIDHKFFHDILRRNIRGTFPVPVVHCTYLIRADAIPFLHYFDGSELHEFIIFSKIARDNGIQQYICNEQDFGFQIHIPNHQKDLHKDQEKQLLDWILKQRTV